VSVWRWPLVWAALTMVVIGAIAVRAPQWAELALGIPAMIAAYCAVIWKWGFGPEDRVLFRKT
jgi:hypothetical protein